MKGLKSKIKHFLFKIYCFFSERKYVSENGDVLHYIFKKSKAKSKKLVIVFSGFNGYSVKGRYNYILTLKRNKDNQLFIKDDEGYFNVGTYYLGEKCNWLKHGAVEELIGYVKDKYGIKTTITAGSSKGGSCSLLYGLKSNANYVIVGSPQYEIASYLNYYQEGDYGKNLLGEIVDEENGYDCEYIDNLLKEEIKKYNGQSKIILLYSSKEPSYDREVHRMVDYLLECNVQMIKRDYGFCDHHDIGKYVQKNLKKIIEKIEDKDCLNDI